MRLCESAKQPDMHAKGILNPLQQVVTVYTVLYKMHVMSGIKVDCVPCKKDEARQGFEL